jgi:hypothetical protein
MKHFLIQRAEAADVQTYTLLEPFRGVTSVSPSSPTYYTEVYTTLLILTVTLAVLMIVVGGIQYSASSVSPSLKNEAKSRISSAVGGLILALVSWLILQTINPEILKMPTFL